MRAINMVKICRACLTHEGPLKSIFTIDEESYLKISFADMIMSSSPLVKIDPKDGLPNEICSQCCLKVIDLYKFKMNIEQNEQILRSTRAFQEAEEEIKHFPLKIEDNPEINWTIKKETLNHEVIIDETKNEDEMHNIDEEINVPEHTASNNDPTEGTDFNKDNCFSDEVTAQTTNYLSNVLNQANNLEHFGESYTLNRTCNIQNNLDTSGFLTDKYYDHMTIHPQSTIILQSQNLYQRPSNHQLMNPGSSAMERHPMSNYNIQGSNHTIEIIDDRCHICKKEFQRPGHLEKHLLRHKTLKCAPCNKTFMTSKAYTHHLRVHRKRIECEVCGKLLRAETLKIHLMNHSEERPYKCEQCGKGFSFKPSYNRHLKSHTGEKVFKCDHCDKSFSQKHNLQQHLLVHTNDDTPFKCTNCDKKFAYKSVLQVHLLSHTREKFHECKECNQKFKHKANLKSHLIKHEDKKKDTDELQK